MCRGDAQRLPRLEARDEELGAARAEKEPALRRFAEEERRGALTDRGRTLILLGGPKEYARNEIGEYLARLYRTGQPPRPSSSDIDAHIQMQGVSFNLNKEIISYGSNIAVNISLSSWAPHT